MFLSNKRFRKFTYFSHFQIFPENFVYIGPGVLHHQKKTAKVQLLNIQAKIIKGFV